MRDPLGYYALLGVNPDASPREIRRAYIRRAKQFHPDANAAPDADEQMRLLNEAYEILCDPQRRAAYDRAATTRAGSHGGPGWSRPWSDRTGPPPEPTLSDSRIVLDGLRPGETRVVTVRVRNNGGACAQVLVDPDECGPVRLVSANLPDDGDGVANLAFNVERSDTSVSDGLVPPTGAWVDAVFRVALDEVGTGLVFSVR